MTNTKWLRSALLGGVAISVMATGAQAGELSDLKAQLEALQTRVNTIETAPTLPAGVSAMTVAKGQGSLASWGNESARDAANVNADRGYTISINPTADLPAPVTEITVYGYAKLDFSWAADQQAAYENSMDMTQHVDGTDSRWYAHAQQSRFGIKAKTDTAIGQIRSKIEGDFYGSPYATSTNLRMRHAYGEWDMTPNWTLVAGQTWHTASLLPIGVSTIDFSGDAGPTYSRSAQLSLAYHNGPIKGLIGISSPQNGSAADYPDLGGRLQYTSAGGHEFIVAASVADDGRAAVAAVPAGFALDPATGVIVAVAAVPAVTATNGTSWHVAGGANIRLGDMATITTGALYGKGRAVRRYLNQEAFGNFDVNGNGSEMWGASVGVQFNVSESTTVNAQFGYSDNLESNANSLSVVDDVMTIHANILWRPVKQMRLGWEVSWGRNDMYVGPSESNVNARFGAWFFF